MIWVPCFASLLITGRPMNPEAPNTVTTLPENEALYGNNKVKNTKTVFLETNTQRRLIYPCAENSKMIIT